MIAYTLCCLASATQDFMTTRVCCHKGEVTAGLPHQWELVKLLVFGLDRSSVDITYYAASTLARHSCLNTRAYDRIPTSSLARLDPLTRSIS